VFHRQPQPVLVLVLLLLLLALPPLASFPSLVAGAASYLLLLRFGVALVVAGQPSVQCAEERRKKHVSPFLSF
jgi:hypothetical protein